MTSGFSTMITLPQSNAHAENQPVVLPVSCFVQKRSKIYVTKMRNQARLTLHPYIGTNTLPSKTPNSSRLVTEMSVRGVWCVVCMWARGGAVCMSNGLTYTSIVKESLFYSMMPLEHIDFHIIGYWTSSIWSM